MLSHIEAPYTPFAVGAGGEQAPMPACYPVSCSVFDYYFTVLGLTRDEYGERLADYLAYTNRQVLEAVADVVHERLETVVIVLSNHGARYDTNYPQDHFRNLSRLVRPASGMCSRTAPTS